MRALRIKLANKDQRFLQANIAKSFGMNPSTIAKYESGERHIPYDYVERFARFAEVSEARLISLSYQAIGLPGNFVEERQRK